MTNKINLDASLLEQHWIHARHIESERMWIMGIWLGITAVMLKEIWMPAKSTILGVHGIKSTSIVHLMITVAVLLIILKLELVFSKHMKYASKIAVDRSDYEMKGLWEIIKLPKLLHPIVICFVTLRGVISIVLIGGIFLDWNMLLMANKGERFINRFQYWPTVLIICILIVIIHEIAFRACENKLEQEIKVVDKNENSKDK